MMKGVQQSSDDKATTYAAYATVLGDSGANVTVTLPPGQPGWLNKWRKDVMGDGVVQRGQKAVGRYAEHHSAGSRREILPEARTRNEPEFGGLRLAAGTRVDPRMTKVVYSECPRRSSSFGDWFRWGKKTREMNAEPPHMVVRREYIPPFEPVLDCNARSCFSSRGGCRNGPHCCRPRIGACLSQLESGVPSRPPPWPVPPNPLGFATCLDRKSREDEGCFCCVSDRRHECPPPEAGGGIIAFLKDALGLGALLGAGIVEKIGKAIQNTIGPMPDGALILTPALRYPDRNGIYEATPPTATRQTGYQIIDKVNNTLDALLVNPQAYPELVSEQSEEYGVSGRRSEYPATKETGNVCVDKTNKFLDGILVSPPPLLSDALGEQLVPSTISEKFQCLIHCRNGTCRWGRWDCAGVKIRHTWTRNAGQPTEKSWMEYLGLKKPAPYREVLGERICPEVFGRGDFYCRHCDRNQFTGKKRMRVELPVLQNPLQCRRHYCQYDNVNFDLQGLVG